MTAGAMLLVGGYTDREDAPAEAPAGLSVYESSGGEWTRRRTLPIPNATWLEWDEQRRVLYVSQSSMTTLTAIRIPDGPQTAEVLDVIDIGAVNPAHLALSPDGRSVHAACFTAGEVVTVAREADGGFGGVRGRVVLGRDAEPHQVVFAPGGAWFAVPDRARDAIHRFRVGAEPVLVGATRLPAGRGPRHLTWHPRRADVAYLAGELDSTVAVLRAHHDDFEVGDAYSTLPDGAGENAVSAIFCDAMGARLYVANRGHDSLAVFDIASDALEPRRLGWIDAGGRTPRYAGLLGESGVLAIAVLDSHRVNLLDVSSMTGALRQRLAHAAPACVRLIPDSPAMHAAHRTMHSRPLTPERGTGFPGFTTGS